MSDAYYFCAKCAAYAAAAASTRGLFRCLKHNILISRVVVGVALVHLSLYVRLISFAPGAFASSSLCAQSRLVEEFS